jgi:DNA-binding NarL/FixJ family response regulator
MESNSSPKILVISDDQSIYGALSNISGDLSITAETRENAVGPDGNGSHQIVIVDLQTLNKDRFELIQEATRDCPHAKIIALKPSQTLDERHSFSLAIFRCLDKPIDSEFLSCTIHHALEIQAKERIIDEMAEKLDSCAKELETQRLRLEYLNQELVENRAALFRFAEGVERERERVEKNVSLNLKSIVIPTIDKLKKTRGLEAYSSELDLIASQIEDITSDFIIDTRLFTLLTAAELRVASLIRSGLNTNEIARKLNISADTISTHRKNIRKKLHIKKASYNLKNFLQSRANVDIGD